MSEFVLPDYRGACLANLLPSIEARLMGQAPVIKVPSTSRYVVLLVDGLGWEAVAAHAADSALFAPGLETAQRLTCAIPSTTATSLTAIGCGLTPGQHGVVGYSFLDPQADQIVNALTWEGGPQDIPGFACAPTYYQRLRAQGITSGCVSLARFASSGLQQLAFGGTEHFGIQDEQDIAAFVNLVMRAVSDHELVYAYERLLDHEGHAHGVGSWQWLGALAKAEDLVMALTDALPSDTCLLVTGDHGMVNVPGRHQIVIEENQRLQGVRLVGGEPRLRQLYTDHPDELARSWAAHLGERGLVWLRDEALEAGWFGPIADRVRPRIGDVLVAMRGDWAVHTRALPREFGLVGQHGSLTAEEMYVPLFSYGGP